MPTPAGQAVLGEIWKDVVTGYEGIVTARTEWLMGCDRITLQRTGTDKDGKPYDPHGFDEPFCEYVKPGPDAVMQKRTAIISVAAPADPIAAETPAARPRTGGPRPDPTRF